MDERKTLAVMRRQFERMKKNPQLYTDALSGGFVCAGFGGDLEGIDVPNTLLTGTLPAGTSVQEAFSQTVRIMEQTIREAERSQGRGKIEAGGEGV